MQAFIASGELGQMVTPNAGNRIVPGARWAADNGCFGDQWDVSKWIGWLAKLPREGCLFAVCPDVVADAQATLDRLSVWGEPIRALGYPVAFVGQDGIEHLAIPWGAFDVWFTGGSTEWKLSHYASALARQARERGKWTHLGRVNSRRRYLGFADLYDSCDGTYLAFGPDQNLPKLLSWIDSHHTNPSLFAS